MHIGEFDNSMLFSVACYHFPSPSLPIQEKPLNQLWHLMSQEDGITTFSSHWVVPFFQAKQLYGGLLTALDATGWERFGAVSAAQHLERPNG